MSPTRARDRWARIAAGAWGVALVAALAGCASPAATLDGATGQGVSAVATARVVVQQDLDRRTFDTTAIATLGDARTELTDAATTVSETDVTTAEDAAWRAELADALARGIRAVNAARDAMAGVGSLEEALAELETAATELEGLESTTHPGGVG